jgi:hypothetical protein
VYEVLTRTSLPEWSKGVVLRTTKRELAWVRTPQLVNFFLRLSHPIRLLIKPFKLSILDDLLVVAFA